jgi:hypothetical protein
MKAGVGQVDLNLDTDGSNDLEPRRRSGQMLEQRRFANSGVAAH